MVISAEKLRFDKHIISTAAPDMRDMIASFQRLYGIHHFGYEKLYRNNIFSLLTTHPAPSEIFHQKRFYELSFHSNIDEYHDSYHLSDHIPTNEISILFRDFDVAHEFIIVKKAPDYCEFFFFATTNNNTSINNFYINHIDLFENFILQFKEQGKRIIKQAEKNLIQYTETSPELLLTYPNSQTSQEINSNSAIISSQKKLLTPKESECLQYVKKGASAK